ncbi:MAG: type I toxin-antitoxin system SymE family toxin [Deltaproteobacteria bacterium]|nr:type I toxin-antitoxin system SymE family toxin [Deltaproteobacteria bacterium]
MCRPTRKFSSVSKQSNPVEAPAERTSACLLTREGKKILARHQAANGRPLFHEASASSVSEGSVPTAGAIPSPTQNRREAKRQRRQEAKERGRRLLTVGGRWREGKLGGSRIPDLRITGLWLEKAGFGLGQEVEIEIEEGRLTIQAV